MEPSSALPFIGWCGVKSKTSEAFRKVCFLAHSNSYLFQPWYFFGRMEISLTFIDLSQQLTVGTSSEVKECHVCCMHAAIPHV